MHFVAIFAIAALSSILYFTIFWSLSLKYKKIWLADIAWATGFFVVYLVSYLINRDFGFKQNIILLMLFFWGFRLSSYLLLRNFNKEDFRYQQIKDKWGNKIAKNSFLKVFLPQSLALILINTGALIASTSNNNIQIGLIDYIAVLIWLVGFLTESIADLEMFRFKSNPNNLGKINNRGLWKYSRHPNYLGEIIMWIGIFVLVLPLPYGLISIISPIAIAFFLVKVTGVNLVEKRLKTNPDYENYIKNTPSLVPRLNIKDISKFFKTAN